MKKVYIITSGDYSDYGIVTVFKDKENAEKFVKKYPDCEVEEYKFSDNDFKKSLKIPLNKKVFTVRMDRDGSVDLLMEEEDDFFLTVKAMGKSDELVNYRHGGDSNWQAMGGKFLYAHILANDKKHAVKIANERRTRLIAENKWPEKKEEKK